MGEYKTIIASDIHGELECLEELIKLGANKYIFLGDYIDRGNNSLEVIRKIIELGKKKKAEALHESKSEMQSIRKFHDPDLMKFKKAITLPKKFA